MANQAKPENTGVDALSAMDGLNAALVGATALIGVLQDGLVDPKTDDFLVDVPYTAENLFNTLHVIGDLLRKSRDDAKVLDVARQSWHSGRQSIQ